MTKLQIDYSNTYFYKIVCKDVNITNCYVGHTTNFIKRKNLHKTACCNIKSKHHNIKLYHFIRENGEWENWSMIIIEVLPFNNVLEVRRHERQLVESHNATLNFQTPSRHKHEWHKDNIEHVHKLKKRQI
jgi:hypothetical protein